MWRKCYLILTVIFLIVSKDSVAQNKIVGMVVDTADSPLMSASVMVVRSKQGAVTDRNGRFELSIPGQSVKIEISLLGFTTQVITANVGQELLVRMAPAQQNNLSEVVVVGVQTQSRRTATSAISSVVSKDIQNQPSPSVDQLLQGRVPGLNVQVTSGEPGVAPTMVVRGNSRASTAIGDDPNVAQARALSGPLYVIDGIPVNADDISSNLGATGTNFLAGINVNDIESVDVQKDAAATAAWGSRGANGVIYIKTKKGRTARPEFRVNVYGGAVRMPDLLKTATGSAERSQKLAIINQYATPAQLANLPQILTDLYNPSFNNATDWQGLFYRNGSIQNVDASMSAANELLNYRLSMNYYNEKGIITSFGFKRYALRGNFDFKISDKLNSQFILGLSKSERMRGRKYNNSDDNTPVSGYNQPSSFYRLNDFDIQNFKGLYSKLRNDNSDDYYSGAFTLNYSILPSLKYTLQASANVTASNRDYFEPSNIDAVAALDPDATPTSSFASSQKGNYTQYFVSNTLNWNKSFETANSNKHSILFTAGQQFSRDVINSNYLAAYNIPSNDIHVVPGGGALLPTDYDLNSNSNFAASSILSYLGQLTYDYNSKYILYGSLRADASSRFGTESKWGLFPAVGAGWIISDENFMKNTKNVITLLKLRGSYGISGDNSSDYYAPYNTYVISGTYDGSTAIQPNYNNGLTKNNLTWSQVIQKNVGIEAYLFKSRISLVLDVYDKLSKNGFWDFELPFFTGFGSINFNATDLWISNRGVDVQLGVKVLPSSSKFQWNTQLNVSYNKNLFAKLPNDNRTFVLSDYNSGFSRIYAVGQPVYEMFQIKYDGVYNNASEIPFNPLTGKGLTYFKGNHVVVPGDPKWRDVNNSGDVWPDEDNGAAYGDRIPTGDPNPKFTGGWVNDFSYKNFSLSLMGIFTWKRDVINTYFQQQIANITGGYSSSIYTFAKGRLPDLSGINYWTPEKAQDPNYKADYPALNPFVGGYYQFIPLSSMFNEDGSYFKLRNITLGYQIAPNLVQRIKLKGARVYGMVDNVFVLKNSSMPNPELVDQLGVYSGGAYPTPTKFTLGIDIQF